MADERGVPEQPIEEGAEGSDEQRSGRRPNRYARLIERLFFANYQEGATEVVFRREEIEKLAAEMSIRLPKNLGDLIYSFRYRAALPASVVAKAPAGKEWIILPAGRSRYRFTPTDIATIVPRAGLVEIKVPDATPGIILTNALGDEQAILAKVRYNRLVDLFLGVVCYSLQSHLRTFITDVGQVETDEVYVGIDRRGAQYVVPVQAKRGRDRMSVVQIWQDVWMCAEKFDKLVCRPVAAIEMEDDLIALILFEQIGGDIRIAGERHYRLAEPGELTDAEIRAYNASSA